MRRGALEKLSSLGVKTTDATGISCPINSVRANGPATTARRERCRISVSLRQGNLRRQRMSCRPLQPSKSCDSTNLSRLMIMIILSAQNPSC